MFLNNLQALRAYAATNVVLVHLLPLIGVAVHFGLYGVDLFFVLSGFLMAMIMVGEADRFLTRRLLRIVPMYWICTFGVFALALVKPAWLHSTKPDLVNLAKSLAFVPYRKEGGVIQPMLFLGWTLNYEMYFYMVCALVLSLRIRRQCLCVSAIIAIAPLSNLIFPALSDPMRFYSQSIVFEFVVGMFCYHLFNWKVCRHWKTRWIFLLLFLCLMVMPCLESILGLAYRQLFLGLPAAGIVFAAACLEDRGFAINNRWLLLMGSASFVLYLTHPYVLLVAVKPVSSQGLLTSFASKTVLVVLLTGVALALACLVHLWFEIPLLRKLNRLILPVPIKVVPEVRMTENISRP